MPVRLAVSILYVITALVSSYWGLRVMFTPSSGGRFFWWPLIIFGAPILLLVGAILTTFHQVRKRWLVAFAIAILFAIWAAFIRDFSWTYLIFAVVVTLTTCGALALASALQRGSLVAIIASVALAAWWVPASVRTLTGYFSPRPSSPDPMELLWALTPALLVIASIIAGVVLSKSPGPGAVGGFGQPAAHF